MSRVRVVLVCLTLQMGVMCGVPMRPEKVGALMHQMNQPKVARVLASENQ